MVPCPPAAPHMVPCPPTVGSSYHWLIGRAFSGWYLIRVRLRVRYKIRVLENQG